MSAKKVFCNCGLSTCAECAERRAVLYPRVPSQPATAQPHAHVWIDDAGQIVSVVATNVPDGTSLPEDVPWCLMFSAEWEVTVTDLGARP